MKFQENQELRFTIYYISRSRQDSIITKTPSYFSLAKSSAIEQLKLQISYGTEDPVYLTFSPLLNGQQNAKLYKST